MQSETQSLVAVVATHNTETAAEEVRCAEEKLIEARAHLEAAIELLSGDQDSLRHTIAKVAESLTLAKSRLLVLRMVPMGKGVGSPL
jgi:hypothetical protein